MVFNKGQLVVWINECGEDELGIVVIQYDNCDTEVMFAGGYQSLVCGYDIKDGYLIPLEEICE